ncbi:fluoride efflux transporter CrcB [Niveispirillum sp. SYP-B3756]|uniref:fluoride efflux transporter CrcB n=1 Tax=Niveispirillum sp. SYP-B3756 TaxID=2662178 RepID=UPI0012920B27|nr:fluoride efflux transporter CrcB [Niveispirillum sp. SYP-B3756]MQP67684.1 fluoride efflux transporter CrcB [Niveispirillum sp. SYP-B3756]
MKMVLYVAFGGALGSVARYLTAQGMGRWLGADFPWATLTVNIVGSTIMGLLVGMMAHFWSPPPELRAFLTVGILGGFTTFSTFSLDVATLLERGDLGGAAFYLLASLIVAIGGLFAGLYLVRMVTA